ncbi:efflux RND transporter periplasmic adaptor subunit [Algoriphagus hitonicola]|nr:HlyD family efflux transporter periplasmic adaptor subunit [Algoriphagus hitonicola]
MAIFSACSKPDTSRPETKLVREAVYASGFVEAKEQVELRAQVDGILIRQEVQEGEMVQAGQLLFLISGKALDSRLTAAQISFEIAQKNASEESPVIQEAENSLQIAKEQYLNDSLKYQRFSRLLDQRATSQSQYENVKTAFESSRLTWKRSQHQFTSKQDQVKRELEAARRDFLSLSDELGFYQVKSDREGIFFQSEKEVGELVRPGEILGTMGSMDGFIGNLKIDEQDIGRIKLGQKVLFEMDAFPGQQFSGELIKIYAKVDPADQMLRVDASILDELPAKFTGLALEANILIREKEDALIIPGNFLLPGDSVQVYESGKVKKVKVKPGIRTLSEVEILEGLDINSQLIKP